MAKYTYINGSLSALADILEESGYFDTVTYDSVNDVLECSIDGNTVFRYAMGTYGYVIYVCGIIASFQSAIGASTYRLTYYPNYVYECTGGISIVCGYGRIVITKNQRDETTVIFNTGRSSSSTNEAMATIGAIAYTDSSTFENYKVNTNTSSQTLLIPICSCAAFDTESYTTTVLIAAYKQFTTVGFLTYNNKRYFFDGYFATEDTETSGGAS